MFCKLSSGLLLSENVYNSYNASQFSIVKHCKENSECAHAWWANLYAGYFIKNYVQTDVLSTLFFFYMYCIYFTI